MLTRMYLPQPQSDGLILAGAILAGMLIGLAYTGAVVWRGFRGGPPHRTPTRWQYAVPMLALVGLAVAGYLTFVETTQIQAVCGPIGDCNTVQNSPYAKIFGLPLGIVGLAGYAAILAAWLWGRRPAWPLADQMPLVVFCAALFSVLFSIYLTYLEISVIRATCIWCLTSAIVVTLILLLSTGPMLQAGLVDETDPQETP